MRPHLHAAVLLAWALTPPVDAALVVNGGFESGLSGWTTADQAGGNGTFAGQSGTTSPVNGFTVPAPPQGLAAAMTDALGPGGHVLYQDIVVPGGGGPFEIAFALYVRNAEGAGDFFVPGSPTGLDFATPALNQQARVDVLPTSADPFSVAPVDVLQNLYATAPGDPLVSGYTSHRVDVTALFQSNPGATLRLRFADVDNVSPFNLGVDEVSVVGPLSATKVVAGTFHPGGIVVYTVTLALDGDAVEAQADNPGDELTDVLPAELTLLSATATSGTASANAPANTVTWNGAIPAGGTVTITIHAIIGAAVASGTEVSNQGIFLYDADGDGTNDFPTATDDPAIAGLEDPTRFVVAALPIAAIPSLDLLGLLVLALALAAAAALRLRG